MFTRVATMIALTLFAVGLSACGWVTPAFDPLARSPYDTGIFVNRIANQVKCELGKAVYDVIMEYQEKDANPVGWLATWGAKATLKIIVEEQSNLSPSVLVTPPGTFSLNANGSLSADATRTETVNFYFVFADLLDPKTHRLPAREPKLCEHYSDILIESDLKLKEWVETVGLLASTPKTVSDPFKSGGPLDTTSHEVQFVVTLTGGITPIWKLVSVTVNPSGTFLGATRARTDDLLITMGPMTSIAPGGRPLVSTQAIDAAHLGAQIQGITTAIQSLPR
ncbi:MULTISPECIES: hypothetical protein [unclassified Bradyrhizobium]|uniref:hypothetical protein n=2 Tax=unclassified Bradyrhizobium TaxID=2631580 RepID=UPI0028E8781C|nr:MULTISPECIES: hypothetical protein [unclassified Bradyrhizobium]